MLMGEGDAIHKLKGSEKDLNEHDRDFKVLSINELAKGKEAI
jgi:hypothetical protein